MTEHKGHFERAAEIFERASQLQGEARKRYVDEACDGDALLRAEIDSMLDARAEQGEFLASPTHGDDDPHGQTTKTSEHKRTGEGPGTVIGRYKLLQRIGEGGFGTVYMAEQQEPVIRKVALKIIKLGMDTKQVIARFEAERQALAMMDHPHIAKVFDAGATETGRPYFVMELVKGIPITDYCDQENLSTKERLDLFMPVCHAVQHAHHKGIIHRDIKPSNVLVTLHDGKPVPKVIDFGIAKATDHRLTEKTLFTEFRQLVGTPAYMSPEQAEMSGLDVDTRTDIYSLGVLLYELLTGTTPFDAEKLRRAAYGEIQRIIREIEPPRPSTRLSTLGADQLTGVAKHRKAEPRVLSKLIRGDLDWIVMKALEKDRTRRYETAKELAKDIEHHLANQPTLAGPPKASYKLHKFIKRNRVAVTAGSLVAAAIVLGLIVSTIGFVQARRQRARAIAARDEAVQARMAEAKQRRLAIEARIAETEQRRLAEAERDRALHAEHESQRQAYIANISGASASLAMNEMAAVRRFLDVIPRESRGWEWRYLNAQTDDSLMVLRGHEISVNSVAFSPDGRLLASGSGWGGHENDDYTVRIWDARIGNQLTVLRGHQGAIRSVAFSLDAKRLASASGWGDPNEQIVRIWNTATSQELFTLNGHRDVVNSVSFSPDGKIIASGSFDKTVRLWRADTGKSFGVLRGHDDFVSSVAFSPNGRCLASGSADKTIRLWNVPTHEQLAVLCGHDDWVSSIAFSSDGAHLASASGDKTIRIWDVSTHKEVAVLRGHQWGVLSVAFSPDATHLASGSMDRTVRIWDIASGSQMVVLRGHDWYVTSVAFSPDGKRIASGSEDKTVRLWDASTVDRLPVLRADRFGAGCVAFSPDGNRVASGYGTVVSTTENPILLWDSATGEEIAALLGHEHGVTSVAFAPEGSCLASGSYDRTVRLWDAFTGEELQVLRGHQGIVLSVAFSPDGTRVASSSSGSKPISDRSWDIDGPGNTVRIWDVSTGEALGVLRGHERGVTDIAFSPDSTRIASASADKTVRLWNARTGEQLRVLRGHEGDVRSVALSQDGNLVASASTDRTIRIWDAATGESLLVLRGHERPVWSVAFSPDGTRLASASGDATVRLWEPLRGTNVFTIWGHDEFVTAVTFAPDGMRLASKSFDGAIRIWETEPYRVRRGQRQAILAAQPAAERISADLWQKPIEAKSIQKRLRTDTSLTEPLRRAALNLLLRNSTLLQEHVDKLYARLVFTDDVVASLEADSSLAPGARYKAVGIAERRGDKPLRLNRDSWHLVCSPNRDADVYRVGLCGAKAAVAAEPENIEFLSTLGMAQYRNGQYQDAHATLTRDHDLRLDNGEKNAPQELAVLAMALFKLGRIEESHATFERLDEMMNDSNWWWSVNEVASSLCEEARRLIHGDQAQANPPAGAKDEE